VLNKRKQHASVQSKALQNRLFKALIRNSYKTLLTANVS